MSAFFFAVPGIYDLLDIHTPVTLRIPQGGYRATFFGQLVVQQCYIA